jgi:hypothetical protein
VRARLAFQPLCEGDSGSLDRLAPGPRPVVCLVGFRVPRTLPQADAARACVAPVTPRGPPNRPPCHFAAYSTSGYPATVPGSRRGRYHTDRQPGAALPNTDDGVVVLVIGLILLLLARWAGPSAAADIIGNNAGGGYSWPQNRRGISELALRAGAPEFPASAPFVMTPFWSSPYQLPTPAPASDVRRFPGAFYWGVATSAIGLTGLALGRPGGDRVERIAVVSRTGYGLVGAGGETPGSGARCLGVCSGRWLGLGGDHRTRADRILFAFAVVK